MNLEMPSWMHQLKSLVSLSNWHERSLGSNVILFQVPICSASADMICVFVVFVVGAVVVAVEAEGIS